MPDLTIDYKLHPAGSRGGDPAGTQMEQRREVPQQRNFEQRPMEQRAQPRNEQPHSNFQQAPQRNTAPSNNGGSLRRH